MSGIIAYMASLIEELDASQQEKFITSLEIATRLTPQQLDQYKSVAREVTRIQNNMDDTLKARRASTVCAKVCKLSNVVPEAEQSRIETMMACVSQRYLKGNHL